jgi:site-specific DNA recombinase
VYHSETFRGDHEPILDPALFAAVQAKLTSQAVERRCRIRGSPALLTGRLFDEQGHRMTPTHTNKKGVRYSYYVSQTGFRKQSPGSIGRVPAPELQALVVDAIRRHLQGNGTDTKPIPETGRELVEQRLLRVILSAKQVTLHLRQDVASGDPAAGKHDATLAGADITPETIVIS